MKKMLFLALLLIPTSLQAQTYTQLQWGVNKGVNPYQFGANINGTWSNLGTVSSTGTWLIPVSNISGGGGLPLLSSVNTWTALQIFSTTRLGSAPTIPTGFTPPLATWESAYPGNTASADPFRFAVGGFPINNEFFGFNPTSATVHGVAAVTGAIKTPLGATSNCGGGAPCIDMGVAGYAQSLEPTRAPVAIFGEAGIGVDGGFIFGSNMVAVNCKNHDASCTPGNAYNVAAANGLEVDVVAYDTPSGPPTGTFYGIQALLNRGPGYITPVSSVAFAIGNFAGGAPWSTGVQCSGGATVNCLLVGPTALSGTSKNTQNIAFTSLNSGGGAITNTLFQDSAGSLQFNSTTGGYTYQLNTAYPQIRLIGGSNAQVGQSVSTSATTGAVASYILETGTAGNTMSANLFNAGNMNYTGGINVNSIVFQLGAVSPTNILTLTRGGGAQIGAPTGGDQGAGTLNATGLYVNGNLVLSGSFPVTVSGAVNSGGIPYFNSTTQMSSSGTLLANSLVIGGGAGFAPSTTTTGTGVVTAIGNNTNTAGGLVVPSSALGSGQIVLGGGSGSSPTTSANASIATGALTLGAAGTQGSVTMGGSTSGTLQIKPAAVAGSGSILTLPGGTTDFSSTGGTSQVVRQSTAGGALTVSQLAASDLSNGTTGSTSVVLSNTPTLTTPVLGAATGTSLALGTTLTSGQVLTVSGNTATSGYLYSGATSAPTNTTAGDITGTRLILGNVSTSSAFSLFRVSGSVAGTGAAPNTTAYAMYFDAAFTSATNYGWGIASYPQVPATGALTSLADFYAIGSTVTAGGSITTLMGFYVSTSLTSGTNNYGFRCQLAASGTARYCNYSDGTALNLFAGNTRIGGTTSPSYALDVTGDTNTSGVFRSGGTAGLTATKTVRDSAGTGTCTLIFTGGILTGGTC